MGERTILESEADFTEGVRCVVMPCCGFTFDANHFDDIPGEAQYTCPCCGPEQEAEQLREERAAREKAEAERDNRYAEYVGAVNQLAAERQRAEQAEAALESEGRNR